jgi:hypothetical protein
LPSPVFFDDGVTYWISIQGIGFFPPQSGWAGHTDPQIGNLAHFRSAYFGYSDWTDAYTVWLEYYDMAFQLTDDEPCPGCLYQVCLEDTYGDGWNDGWLEVFVNSGLVWEGTLLSGSGPECHVFCVETGDEITTIYTEGDYGYENEYYILDEEGYTVWYESGTPGNIPPLTLFADCDPMPTPPGADCSDPIMATINSGTLPYYHSYYTCGMFDDYDATCLGLYDGGEDVIYELEVTEAVDVYVELDPLGTTYTGIAIDDTCPPGSSCMAYSTSSYLSTPHGFSIHLDPGIYYIMIDTWPSPDCIPAYDLSIEAYIPDPGENCDNAVTASCGINSHPGAPYWFEFTAPASYDCVVETCGLTSIDTVLEIWDECSDATYLYRNDDFCGLQSHIEFPAVGGETYYIACLTYGGYSDGQPYDVFISCPLHDVGVSEIISPFGDASPKGTTLYGYNAYPNVIDEGPITFDSSNPGSITLLAPTESIDFISSCTWAEDTWFGAEYASYGNDNIYTIDETNGDMTLLGQTGLGTISLNGMAFDPVGEVLYGGSSTDLYTIDMNDGSATLVGSYGPGGPDGYNNIMISIASDADGNLYGVECGYSVDNAFYSIDKATGAATFIGNTGLDLFYAQDLAFDKDDDVLYLAAEGFFKSNAPMNGRARNPDNQKNPGAFYTIDVSTGAAAYAGAFENDIEVSGLAIPYTLEPPECWGLGPHPVSVKVKNYGGWPESFFDVCVDIIDMDTMLPVYQECVPVLMVLDPEDEVIIDTFPPFAGDTPGDYEIIACTYLMGDANPNNDCEDEVGCISAPPICDANGDYYANEENSYNVILDASGSYDQDGWIVSYEWDYDGDGVFDTNLPDPTLQHYYPPMDFVPYHVVVQLRLTDNSGEQSICSSIVWVNRYSDGEPVVQLKYPKGGETLSGTVTVEWFAVDVDHPDDTLPMYLYYSADGLTWRQINDVLPNTGEYRWDTSSLSDGSYMLLCEAQDGNAIGHDMSDPFTIGNGFAGVKVSDVRITDTTIDSNKWVKDGDKIEISAGITGSTLMEREDITADLSGFGLGSVVIADSYDGFNAVWTVNSALCNPSNGPITITVTVLDDSNSATITADNTKPEMTIYKPQNGIYFFNSRLIPFGQKNNNHW